MSLNADWTGCKVLVTGCTGFLGWWLTADLVAKGADVIGLVRDFRPRSPFFSKGVDRRVTLVHGSVEDYDTIERTLNEYEVDTVFHLAAQAIVGVGNRNPMSTFETNIKGTWVLMEACRRSPRLKRVIVASSDKAYGHHAKLPYEEDFALQGRHPYDVSKGCSDIIAQAYFHTYGTPVCVTRCGNIFGPGDMNFNRIVPGTFESIIRNRAPIIRSDGTPVRDYVFVGDISNAYLELAEHMDDPAVHGMAFNFGSGEPVSVLELTQKMLVIAGRDDLQPQVMSDASGEIQVQYLSSERAARLLGWHPQATLDERLDKTYAWYREMLHSKDIAI